MTMERNARIPFEKKRTLDENSQKHSCFIYSHIRIELFSLDFLSITKFEWDFLNLCLVEGCQRAMHCGRQQIVKLVKFQVNFGKSKQTANVTAKEL